MKTLLCTLAIGENKIKECNDLIESFKKYSDFDIVVYSDKLSDINHDNKIDIHTITDMPLKIRSVFNFNLKGLIMSHAYRHNTQYDRIVYSDCDVVLTNKSKELDKLFEADIYAAYGKFNEAHKTFPSGKKFYDLKKALNIQEDILTQMLYLTETFLIVNRSNRVDNFFKNWCEFCNISILNNINPVFECVELGLAIYFTNDLTLSNLNSSLLKKEGFLETKHRNKMIKVIRK